jgi:hypothetical protein
MIRISFVCSWGDSPKTLLETYKKQTPGSFGIWGELQGTDNITISDVVVILGNYAGNTELFRNKELIQFRREPDFIEDFHPFPKALIFDYNNGYHVSTWQFVSKTFDDFVKLDSIKTNIASGVTSDKWEHRNKFFKAIERNNPEVDIYGKNYKKLHSQFKDNALKSYFYSIAIENSTQKNYFTEKINDCFLFLTMPIYWGCPNITDYFPKDSVRLIDINNPKEMDEILTKPVTKKERTAIKEARNLVLYKYNIWPTIEKLLHR